MAVAWGLRDVVAVETRIARVDGERGELVYRGHRAQDLAGRASFEEVAHLLWTGRMPTEAERQAIAAELSAARELSPFVGDVVDALPPELDAMGALRTGVSAMGTGRTPTLAEAVRFTAAVPGLIGRRWARLAGRSAPRPPAGIGHVAYLLWMLDGVEPEPARVRALEAYMVLTMEHGLSASTLAARVVASTRSDLASALAAALGAMRGPLHGGAPAGVAALVDSVPEGADAVALLRQRVARGERLMGFGHRVYRTEDPRAAALRRVVVELAGDEPWVRRALAVERAALEVLEEHRPGRRLRTNVEYWAAAILRWVGVAPSLYTAVFSASRVVGWSAHVLEQVEQDVLIRPEARYVGPEPPEP